MKKNTSLWPMTYSSPEWLPNWQIAEEYLNIVTNTEARFDVDSQTCKQTTVTTCKHDYAWEFLRRNPEYQADYEYLVHLCNQEGVTDLYQKALGLNIFLGKDELPPSLLFHSKLYLTLQKWGMGYYLLDPSSAVHDTATYGAVRRLGIDIFPAVKTQNVYLSDDNSDAESIPVDGGIVPGEYEGFWLFNASLPIEPQLQQARTFLENFQIRHFGKKKQASKTDPTMFVMYLRILDADACEADDDKIMEVLLPGEDTFSYTDKQGRPYKNANSHRNPGRDKLKNYRNAAYSLRDEGFRRLFS